jgi:hypothetical protein
VHTDSQQTPSTQNPDAHSPLAAHAFPFAFVGSQVPSDAQ